jgi:hypothetical protein
VKPRYAIGALAACLLAGSAAGQTPEDLRRLLEQGKADEAYQLGRRAPERLGDPAFDFQFGIAAINAGHAAEGVLALERFTLAYPENDAARVELARGYYLLGDDARAKEEFEAALARKPERALARVIKEYLDAIRARESKYQPTAMAYFEFGGGYDSNPRAGVDNPLVTLPVLGEVTVVDTGLRAGDQTVQYGAGFRLTSPISAHATAFATAQAEYVRYPDVTEFDQDIYAGSIGAQGTRGPFAWRSGIAFGYQTLYRNPYRRTHGLFADGAWLRDERNAFSAGVQAGKFLYEGTNAARNADFGVLTGSWKHLFALAWRPELDISGNFGREKNVYDDRQDLSRDLYGARLGVAASPLAGVSVAAAVVYQRSDYLEPDPTLLTTREDRYSAAEASLAWRALLPLQLRAEFSTAKNESNLAIYEYRRKTALLRLRYEFR